MIAQLLSRLRPWRFPAQEVRAETWALGQRHRGDVIEGARLELRAAGLSPRRAGLLRAVIRHQEARRYERRSA